MIDLGPNRIALAAALSRLWGCKQEYQLGGY